MHFPSLSTRERAPGKLAQVSTGVWFRARMATPFQERSPCQTASYPRVRRAFTGKAPCSALSSWRLTTSGSALANQARRLSSRLLMLLMLKVATLTKSLSAPVPLGAPTKRSNRVRCPGRHYFTGGKKWKTPN